MTGCGFKVALLEVKRFFMRYAGFFNIALIRFLMAVVSVINIYVISFAFDLEQLGNYSVFLAVASYATQLGSLGFNQYLLREVATTALHEQRIKYLGNQLAFLFLIFPLAFTLLLVFGYFDFMSGQSIALLSLYVFLCVFNNAMENFFVASGCPVRASLGAAFRSTWVLVFWGLLALGASETGVVLAVTIMISFEILYLFVNSFQLRGAFHFITCLNKRWIQAGIRIGVKYVVIGLCVLVATSVQRLFLYQYSGEEVAGSFFYLLMLFTFIPNFFEVVLFSVLLPKLVRNRGATLTRQVIFGFSVVLCLSFLLYSLLPFLLPIVGKEGLMVHYEIISLFALYAPLYVGYRVVFNNLYARGEDRIIFIAVLFGVLASLLSAYIFIGLCGKGILGALASLYVVIITVCGCFWLFGIANKNEGALGVD
jgi:O-antigen/teichoic acid export membrane protein